MIGWLKDHLVFGCTFSTRDETMTTRLDELDKNVLPASNPSNNLQGKTAMHDTYLDLLAHTLPFILSLQIHCWHSLMQAGGNTTSGILVICGLRSPVAKPH